jgi:hypothetical protein
MQLGPTSQNRSTNRRQRTPARNHPPSHKPEDLKDFILTRSELNDLTLEDAIEALIAQYRQTCHETGESPISLSYTIEGNSASIAQVPGI